LSISVIVDSELGSAVQLPFDILRMDGCGTPMWVEAVASLELAKARISELEQNTPSEYVIFHSATSKIVAAIHSIRTQ
jgi:hypothetical protein